MQQWKLIITFERLSETNFSIKGKYIVDSLHSDLAQALIPDPWPDAYPSRAMLQTALDEYIPAMHAADDGGRHAISVRKQKRLVLMNYLKDLAPYVESVAKKTNNVKVLNVSGYDRRREIIHHLGLEPLPAPAMKLCRGVLPGTFIASTNRVAGAGSYEVQFCAGMVVPDGEWPGHVISKGCRRIEIPGLTPTQMYSVRVRAIGSHGPGAWSTVAHLVTL